MMRIVEQTYEEKVKMYKKCSKRKLIDMLIQANLYLDNRELQYGVYDGDTEYDVDSISSTYDDMVFVYEWEQ